MKRKAIAMDSQVIEWDVFSFLERFAKRNVFREALLKSFNLADNNGIRIKIWAEKHFGFKLSEEDKQQKISTVGDFISLLVKYANQMTVLQNN